MVSKSKVLGKSSLIFVTVGTTGFKFNRLFYCIEKALLSLKLKPRLIVQTGPCNYRWTYKNIQINHYLSPKKLSLYYSKADRIILHGGFGSLFLLSKKAKIMPLVIARLKKYKEHVNDHQKDFLTFLKKKSPQRLKKYFIDSKFINGHIVNYIKNQPQKNSVNTLIFSENNKKFLIRRLRRYINSS